MRIVCLYNTISSEDVADTAQNSIANFDIKNRNQHTICRFPQHVLIASFHTLKGTILFWYEVYAKFCRLQQPNMASI